MQRIYYLDNIKFFAIISIVCMHVYELLYTTDNIALQIIGRIGVPLFSLVSGILMLPRDYNLKSLIKYFKHSFLPLFITTEIWIVLWACLYEKNVEEIIRCILLLENPCETMWYARMICKLYLVLPFFCMLLHRCKYLFMIIMLGVFLLYSNFYQMDLAWILNKLHLSDTNFMLYLFYMFIGYSIKNLKFHMFYVLVAVAFIISIYFVLSSFHTALWYNSPLLMLLSVPVFLSLRYCFSKKYGLMTLVSRYSYGIYLSHMLLVIVLLSCKIVIPHGFGFLIPIVSCVVVALLSSIIYMFEKFSHKIAIILFRI